MNTRIVAALAVLVMMFAGFGVIVSAQGDDAVVAGKDVVIVYDGVLDDKAIAKIAAYDDIDVKFAAEILDDAESKVTVVNTDDYKALMKNQLDGAVKDGAYIIFDVDVDEDVLSTIATFTTAEINKLGDLTGGVETRVIFDTDLDTAKDVVINVVDEDDAAAAVVAAVIAAQAVAEQEKADAVAQAVADEKAKAKDYKYTQADIDAAKAEVPAGYVSQADAEKMVADAVAGVEPVKVVEKDDLYLYIAIVAIAAAIILAVLFVFFQVIKPKMAKKAEETQTI